MTTRVASNCNDTTRHDFILGVFYRIFIRKGLDNSKQAFSIKLNSKDEQAIHTLIYEASLYNSHVNDLFDFNGSVKFPFSQQIENSFSELTICDIRKVFIDNGSEIFCRINDTTFIDAYNRLSSPRAKSACDGIAKEFCDVFTGTFLDHIGGFAIEMQLSQDVTKPKEPNYHEMSKQQLIKTLKGWKEQCEFENRRYRDMCDTMVSQHLFENDDVWGWMGNDEDDLESMSNGMRIIISAEALRSLINKENKKHLDKYKKSFVNVGENNQEGSPVWGNKTEESSDSKVTEFLNEQMADRLKEHFKKQGITRREPTIDLPTETSTLLNFVLAKLKYIEDNTTGRVDIYQSREFNEIINELITGIQKFKESLHIPQFVDKNTKFEKSYDESIFKVSSNKRMQKLIELIFIIAFNSAEKFHGQSNNLIANWVMASLTNAGYPTQFTSGTVWGQLLEEI